MAQKYSEETRNYYIIKVGDYFINEENPSIRKCINYLKENDNIILSIPTVKSYVHQFVKNNPDKGLEILKKIENNKPNTVDDEIVKKRVLQAAEMILKDNTIEIIATVLNSTIDTIYRDLTVRLKKIDIDLYDKVKNILKEHKISNLNTGNTAYFSQKRDEYGKFK